MALGCQSILMNTRTMHTLGSRDFMRILSRAGTSHVYTCVQNGRTLVHEGEGKRESETEFIVTSR